MFTPFAFYGKAEEGYPWVTTDLRFKVDANYYVDRDWETYYYVFMLLTKVL